MPRHPSLVTRHWLRFAGLLLLLASVPALRADVLKLRDGHKISGTIVGFESGMFRVETDFGFILVRKDKVASIEVTASEPKQGGPGTVEAAPANAKSKESKSAIIPPSNSAASATPPPAAQPPAPPPQPVSRPLNVPLPARIDEHVEGNTYVNDTFHFVMYKPPDWRIYEELHREKVSAIVALASEDEQTVLFVDRQMWSGTPDLKSDSVEAKLRQTYQDYKLVSESNTQVDGHPAIRRRFDGVLDGAEWHGIAVRVAQGSTVYGIIGLTSAEMFEFQEAVLNKIVNSFHFVTPSAAKFSLPLPPRTP